MQAYGGVQGTGMPPRTGMVGTSVGGGSRFPVQEIRDGRITTVVYGLIKDQKYEEVISILSLKLQEFPRSRAALSLLGYAYYMQEDYESAASMYEQLVRLVPSIEEYKIYLAQSLYKSGMYPEATKAALGVTDPQFHQRVQKLLASIKYEEDDLVSASSHLRECATDDPDTVANTACILYKEGKHVEAMKQFEAAINILGNLPQLSYGVAVCCYKEDDIANALKEIATIIEQGIREHPELGVGSQSDGYEVRSVGNSRILEETALVEAFNLKAAIEYDVKNLSAAEEAISDMPPRLESELDPVSLHNMALVNADKDPTGTFSKMNYLLQNPPFPPETFSNLLLLYCKYDYYDLVADVLAENAHLTYQYLTQELYDFIDAVITSQTSPEDGFKKFDALANRHVDILRKHTKRIQDSRRTRDAGGMKEALNMYDSELEKYIPVLMGMARIFWNIENYEMVERVLLQTAEFCSEHATWKLNLAHVCFVQENEFKEATQYYEPIVKKATDILSIPAIVLANLCVSYIMTSANEMAEELMRQIEREEEKVQYSNPEGQSLHLCIVNLVIGTLYCAKGNFEFGISRIIKSLEPYQKKLMMDTWFYAKRCFAALGENLAKHMIILKDETIAEILTFLDVADEVGKNVFTKLNPLEENKPEMKKHTVSNEARILKKMFMKLREQA